MYILPAIDIFDGKCVRLVEGDFANKTTYSSDPLEIAKRFFDAGARHLHVVDLEGAKEKKVINWSSIEKIASIQGMEIQLGGGVRTESDIDRLRSINISYIIVGSIAIQSPETLNLWIEKYGAQQFCVALDIKDNQLAFAGWQELQNLQLTDVIQNLISLGISRFLSTDIRRDGTLAGPNTELYTSLVQQFPKVTWLASGGVRSIEDVQNLKAKGVAGAIIGKALYEGTIKLDQLLSIFPGK